MSEPLPEDEPESAEEPLYLPDLSDYVGQVDFEAIAAASPPPTINLNISTDTEN
jgi:hypothetical protein